LVPVTTGRDSQKFGVGMYTYTELTPVLC
jgi:hypothetical protein